MPKKTVRQTATKDILKLTHEEQAELCIALAQIAQELATSAQPRQVPPLLKIARQFLRLAETIPSDDQGSVVAKDSDDDTAYEPGRRL